MNSLINIAFLASTHYPKLTMPYIADLHTHSRFAGACSPQLTIPNLAKWAQLKGIDLLGSGDCLYPGWIEELKRYFQPLPSGFYQHGGTKFVISTEISCIYTENGKSRRIHLLIYLPSINAAEKLANEMRKGGQTLTTKVVQLLALAQNNSARSSSLSNQKQSSSLPISGLHGFLFMDQILAMTFSANVSANSLTKSTRLKPVSPANLRGTGVSRT